MGNSNTRLSRVIIKLRTSMDLLSAELARKVDISVNWMFMIESQGKIPSDDILLRLTSVLEDTQQQIFMAASFERGHVIVETDGSDPELANRILLYLKCEIPNMSRSSLKGLAKSLGI